MHPPPHRHDPPPRGVIARFRDFLPVSPATPIVTLHEGDTPLIPAPRLAARVGRSCQVFVKYEGLNPTGSFKDRGMTMAISKALEAGASTVICASTGNTSAAAAAYAARAGLACLVLLPAGKIAGGKLAQAFVYGAKVISLRGNFDDALRLVRELGDRPGFEVVNSINPYRIEGQKSAAFEIVEELGDAPHLHLLPVGNAGNITAYWQGYQEFLALGKASRSPVMLGGQAAGAAPLYLGHDVERPETIATAIRIGAPASRAGAEQAVAQSGGAFEIVTDAQILAAQRWLAANEGIFVEPASAASIATLFRCSSPDRCARCPLPLIPEGATIVCTVTGNGLKDPEVIMSQDWPLIEVEASTEAVLAQL
jgi:threonine synthase